MLGFADKYLLNNIYEVLLRQKLLISINYSNPKSSALALKGRFAVLGTPVAASYLLCLRHGFAEQRSFANNRGNAGNALPRLGGSRRHLSASTLNDCLLCRGKTK